MSQASTPTAPPAAAVADALRIVLFGMPAAGKTSLLGALAQAAQTQEYLLHGRLGDRTQGLAELRQRVYEESPRRTAEEVAPYPVEFEPFPEDGQPPPAGPHLDAVLIDCDGRVANDLLQRRRGLPEDSPEGTLAHEVLDADALVLALDVSAPPAQIDADFAEFGRFLRLLERDRGRRAEVGGLPVFLVLTKCDLLAQPGDSPADWMERIEERKRQVGRRFQDFLARKEKEEGPLPFGGIDLHLWATSIKRPALAGAPERPREPYGVAELFRLCFESGAAFRHRQQRSNRLLLWTVAGAAAVAAGLLLLVLLLPLFRREEQPVELQNKVASFFGAQGQTVAERLRGDLPQLEQKIAVLTELRKDPHFGRLPEETRQTVTERLGELEGYVRYLKKLNQARRPASARNQRDLEEMKDVLKDKTGSGLAVPREEWAQTRAGRLHDQLLADLEALRRAVEEVVRWYNRQRGSANELRAFAQRQPGAEASVNWPAWQADVGQLLAAADKPPFREAELVPGAEAVTYATVFEFPPVQEARAEWVGARRQLERVRDLSAALGLGGEVRDRPPLLKFGANFTAAEARGRLQELQKVYPQFEDEFVLRGLPEAVRGDIRQAAQTSYEHLLEAGRAVVQRRLQDAAPGDEETPARWQALRRWLAEPEELSAWRVLARVLVRLQDPDRAVPDPVTELASFLGRDRFELTFKRLTLEVPDRWDVRPAGKLSIYHQPAGKDRITLEFEETDRLSRRPGVTTYTFRPADGRSLTFTPGEQIWAVLPVRSGGGKEQVLTWSRVRSNVYRFERLSRAPRLHRPGQDSIEGEIAEGVVLSVPPGDGELPRVPDLVPFVQLKR